MRKRYWLPIHDLYHHYRHHSIVHPNFQMPPIYGYHPTKSLVQISWKVYCKVKSAK